MISISLKRYPRLVSKQGPSRQRYEPISAARCPSPAVFAVLLGVAASMLAGTAAADNFADVYYDAQTNELVITMSYRGTNPNHKFSLEWGECHTLADASEPEIIAEVDDDQPLDAAREEFKTTTRVSLENLNCRPAKLTLRTAPRFYYTLHIPARPISQR
jgi:hypothetical protein